MMSRYDIGGSQGRYQPGSNDGVLENILGVTKSDDMDEAELMLLEKLYEDVLCDNPSKGFITVDEIKNWHHLWLGNVYEWAGKERTVNMRKGNFLFAAAIQITPLLSQFEEDFLRPYTPCFDFPLDKLLEAIAIIHSEFILIHPFRDGNGRLSRLLADVMAVQAGYQPLDYSCWDKNRLEYFAAIRLGCFDRNYGAMENWVKRAMSESI